MNLQRIVALLKKEFGQLLKDKKLLPIVFVAPVLQLTFMGYAASLDVKNVSMVLCDLDKSAESRAFIEKFTNSGYFTIEYSTEDQNAVGHYIDNHQVNVGIVIPPRFSEKLLRRESASLQVILDGSEGNTAAITMAYINQIIASYSKNILAEISSGAPATGGIDLEIRTWFNAALKSRNYMVPGVLVMILLITTMNLTSMAIVKEKEIGTLEQLMVTPITPTELIIGKLVPFTMIGIFNVIVVLLVMVHGFGIPVKGSYVTLAAYMAFFLMTTLGLGLFISTVSKTQQQAMMTSTFFVIMPMMYLSGFTFPIDNMPKLLQFVSLGLPMRHFLTVVRSITLKGVGFTHLWFEAAALIFMGATILVASVLRFRKKLD
ncbi:MAG TPA: ABC transporter permease [Bacteroidota bacterium]|nr:ABC transporter permease [Bacteroidota bacterium]